MATPTKDAILELALHLFQQRNHNISCNIPEEHELKESGIWEEARDSLMRNEGYETIDYLEEMARESGFKLVKAKETDQLSVSGFRFDVKEATKTGFYCSGTSGIGKSDIGMYAASELMKHGVGVIVFDSTMDWIERSNIPSYITVKPNIQFKFALDGRSFIFDIHLLNPEQRLELVEWFCGILYRHQALRPKAERKKFVVVLEESHTFLYQGSMRSKKAMNVRMLLMEGRNFNARIACITQFASMLDKDAMKFMKQRYVGWTDEPNDIAYVTNMIGGHKEKLKSLKAGQFLYKHGNDVSMIEIDPFQSETKAKPLLIQAEPFARSEPIKPQAKPNAEAIALLLSLMAFAFVVGALLV